MKKAVFSALIAGGALFFGGATSASAVTLDTSDTEGTQSLTYDDNGNVVAASSSQLFDKASQAGSLLDEEGNSREAATYGFAPGKGQWVSITMTHRNYFNGYKWGNVDYYHASRRHRAMAVVGGHNSGWKTAPAHKHAYATAKGKGSFTPYYGTY